MGHLINPILIGDFMEDNETSSVNGCYQGSDYWEPERLADKALERERKYRQWVISQKRQLLNLKAELAKAESRGHHKKLARLQEQISRIEKSLNRNDSEYKGTENR